MKLLLLKFLVDSKVKENLFSKVEVKKIISAGIRFWEKIPIKKFVGMEKKK